jgi:hypothetical protein
MAVNVTVYDLENYPDNSKTVTVDIKKVTPIGYEGDEQWVVSCTTTAYSDNTNRTAIQDVYIQEIKGGWSKSSGLVTSPFSVTTSNKLRLRLDGDLPSGTDTQIVGTGANAYWEITLTSSGTITGDAIATDMETQIRALADSSDMSSTYLLSYMNASVEYADDKFKIISGSISSSYTGTNKSSVDVYPTAFASSCTATLGFDLPVDTETLAGISMKEVTTTSGYSGGVDLAVSAGLGSTVVGRPIYITDGVNSEYFFADTGSVETSLKIRSLGGNQALVNSYSSGTGTKVQKLSWWDADAQPTNYYEDVDAAVRWAIKTQANQIDYSS